jgi:hypothetical protein
MYKPFAIRLVIVSNNSDLALAPASESYHSFAYAASLLPAGKAFRYLIIFQFLPALPNLARSNSPILAHSPCSKMEVGTRSPLFLMKRSLACMCSRGRKQPLWRDLPGIIQRDPSPSCGPEQTFHPEKRVQEPESLTTKLLEREISFQSFQRKEKMKEKMKENLIILLTIKRLSYYYINYLLMKENFY